MCILLFVLSTDELWTSHRLQQRKVRNLFSVAPTESYRIKASCVNKDIFLGRNEILSAHFSSGGGILRWNKTVYNICKAGLSKVSRPALYIWGGVLEFDLSILKWRVWWLRETYRNYQLVGLACVTGRMSLLVFNRSQDESELRLKGEEWRIQVWVFLTSQQIKYRLCCVCSCCHSWWFLCCCLLSALDGALSFDWKRCADLWKEPFSHSAFNLSPFLAVTMEGEGGRTALLSAAGGAAARFQYQSHTNLVIFPVMFVGVQLFIYFSCRKAGKPIWKKYCSHVISNDLALVPGVGLLTASRRRVGETQLQPRRKKERDLNLPWASLALPSFPLHLPPPWGVTAITLHNCLSHSSQDCQSLACAAFCPLSSTQLHVTSKETTYP